MLAELEEELKYPLVCLYHADCLDGMGAAWAVYRKYPQATFIPVDYGDPLPEAVNDARVLVVDFCYDLDTMIELAARCRTLTLLDHHTSSEETAKIMQDLHKVMSIYAPVIVVHDRQRSGALIAWQFLHPLALVPRILELISDRDLWLFRFPETRQVMQALDSYPMDLECWDKLFAYDPKDATTHLDVIMQLETEGGPVVRQTRRLAERLIQQTMRVVELTEEMAVPGADLPFRMMAPMVNVPRPLASETLSRLNEEYPCVLGYYDSDTHRVFSVRSAQYSLLTARSLAECFGGGGHEHAAGFRVERDHPLAQL